MPWVDNEAKALKAKLAGINFTDVAGTRPIQVWFRNPENELRDFTFPALVIEYAGLNPAHDREHRGTTVLPYIPEEFQPGPYASLHPDGSPAVFDPGAVPGQDFDPTLSPFKVQDFPIPYNLDFTVTLYTRQQTDLVPLTVALSKIDRLPVRFGYLEVPDDLTIRSLDLLAGPEFVGSRDSEGRRLFMAVYSVRVYTELNLYDVNLISDRVQTIDQNVAYIPFDLTVPVDS